MRNSFGLIRLHARPASDVWHARTSVELCAVEPRSTATMRLSAAGLRCGDVAGLALHRAVALAPDHRDSGLSDATAALTASFAGRTTKPCAWMGVERDREGFSLVQCVEHSGWSSRVRLSDSPVWLRVECDVVRNRVTFSYSTNGTADAGIGEPRAMGDHPGAAPVMWYSLFARAAAGQAEGGHADFDSLLLSTARAGR